MKKMKHIARYISDILAIYRDIANIGRYEHKNIYSFFNLSSWLTPKNDILERYIGRNRDI